MDFKDELKRLRKTNDLSQQELADKINVSRSVVAKWETGLVFPSKENIGLLSQLFNTSLEELLSLRMETTDEVENKKELYSEWLKKIKRSYMVSYFKKGIIGGFMYLGEYTITYKTNKLQLPKSIRYFEIAYEEITNIELTPFVMKIHTDNGQTFKFLVYRFKKMREAIELRKTIVKDLI